MLVVACQLNKVLEKRHLSYKKLMICFNGIGKTNCQSGALMHEAGHEVCIHSKQAEKFACTAMVRTKPVIFWTLCSPTVVKKFFI